MFAVWTVVICAFLPSLTLLWSPVFLTNIFTAASLALTISYGVPITCRLVFARRTFHPGPFSLGRSVLTSVLLAVIYYVYIIMIGQRAPSLLGLTITIIVSVGHNLITSLTFSH